MDELFAAIDAKVQRELRTWLKEIIGKVGASSIFVTHDREEAVEAFIDAERFEAMMAVVGK